MRRAHRQDNTHKAIVNELRQMGYSVFDTSGVGKDFPDLVIGRHGITALAEAKTRSKESHRGRKGDSAHELLSEGQAMFRALWRGSPVLVGYDAATIHAEFQRLWQRV